MNGPDLFLFLHALQVGESAAKMLKNKRGLQISYSDCVHTTVSLVCLSFSPIWPYALLLELAFLESDWWSPPLPLSMQASWSQDVNCCLLSTDSCPSLTGKLPKFPFAGRVGSWSGSDSQCEWVDMVSHFYFMQCGSTVINFILSHLRCSCRLTLTLIWYSWYLELPLIYILEKCSKGGEQLKLWRPLSQGLGWSNAIVFFFPRIVPIFVNTFPPWDLSTIKKWKGFWRRIEVLR